MLRQLSFDAATPVIRALPRSEALTRADLLIPELCLYREERLAVYYGPFHHVNPAARVVLIGITPGWTQMEIAYRCARDGLHAGLAAAEIFERIGRQASFAGSMRRNLIAMLDALGLPQCLGISSSESLFGEHRSLLHTASALRYPVFVGGRNYTGHTPPLLETSVLLHFVEEKLGPELQRVPEAILIPLGKAVSDALHHLIEQGVVEEGRCLLGFPHPSGANGHRVRHFQERQEELRQALQRWFSTSSSPSTRATLPGWNGSAVEHLPGDIPEQGRSSAMSTMRLRLPESLHRQVKQLARREGMSINQFIATAVAEKMSALLTEEYLEERAQRGSRQRYEAALAQVADIEPDERDRL